MANVDQAPQSATQAFKEYKWYNSMSLPIDVQCGITRLELPADLNVMSPEIPTDVYFTAHVVCNQLPMHESPVSTFFATKDENRNALLWDYIMTFPMKARDLSQDSLLVLTAWTPDGKVFGGTTMNFFDEVGCLKKGKQKLMFYFGTMGDPNVIRTLNTTPGELYNCYSKYDYRFKLEKDLETYCCQQSNPRPRNEARNDWLDKLTVTQIQACLNDRADASSEFRTWGRSAEEQELEAYCFLIVDMPLLQHPVLHEERQYPTVAPHMPPNSQMEGLAGLVSDETDAVIEFSLVGRPFNAASLTIVADWDMDQDNLAEDQNRRLSQHSRRGAVDATAKPNKSERERIDKVVNAVGSHMNTEEIDLLYRFRYSLTENKRALVKFLYTVNWDEETEVAEVPALLALWSKNAPIDVADALKLLSRDKCFEHSVVREYAVSILRSASDDELLTFLLQLVQALRYEPSPTVSAQAVPVVDFAMESSIVGVNHLDINARLAAIEAEAASPSSPSSSSMASAAAPAVQAAVLRSAGSLSPLANFLIDRACTSPIVANYFYWYLKVETEDEQAGPLFQTVFDNYIVQLSTSGQEGKMLFRRLCALDEYIAKISAVQRDARETRGRKEAKEQSLQKLLEERGLNTIPRGVDWVPMPLDPSIQLMGLVPQTAAMFASAVYPCVIEFIDYNDYKNVQAAASASATPSKSGAVAAPQKPKCHKIMFKSGDDLRQDQLIMQMIALMDRLLKKVNLDLKLLTYGILAVSQKDGIMEFCRNSMPISAVLKNYNNTIVDYLRHHNPDKNGTYGIAPMALDTFVKSCAGYCVITYILGVGDRHLDNVMINTSGQMFHIDFGFIFGQDPKPMPPPFRFIKQMADAMGGEDGENYGRFKTFCCQSYNWLRKSANLILNLLSLMGDAGIQDISKRSDLPKVLIKVEEKFRLDLTDEQAEQFFLGLISESLHSLAPKLMEVAHKIAVSMR